MADDIPIKFDRKPYTVTYKDMDGQTRKLRRVPPEKLHEALPTDIVSLTRKRNDDFDIGENFEVKHINPRHPNTLQLVDNDGRTTFVDSFDMRLEEEVADRDGLDPRDRPKNNRYLLWP